MQFNLFFSFRPSKLLDITLKAVDDRPKLRKAPLACFISEDLNSDLLKLGFSL